MTKNKLWQTDDSQQLHPLVQTFTKGKDQTLDQKLLGYDIQASKAHAEMLYSIGILKLNELKKLESAFGNLQIEWKKGLFKIGDEQEDGHSAIEEYLVDKLGDIGKKIHTGRSRNDQSLVMMRLYMKEKLQDLLKETNCLIDTLKKSVPEHKVTPMPGYTHMQKAMPTSVGVWLESYHDAFKDVSNIISSTQKIIDQNPLGSAAGFGVSIELDKEHTTRSLGFAKTQENPMYCGLSRGLFELLAIQSINSTMMLAGKFAQDMLLFTTEEFNFFSLPDSFTTGSSIMPQKKNYDLFELIRGNSHAFSGYTVQLQAIYNGMGSGYQRDLQLTKEILIEAIEMAKLTLQVLTASISNLIVNKDTLKTAITDEIKSVEKINDLVYKGVPFRDAYKHVKNELA